MAGSPQSWSSGASSPLPSPADGGTVGGIVFAWISGSCSGARSPSCATPTGSRSAREPYGTLILTMSPTAIEVAMISTVMLHGADNPTLARDTMFAVR